MFNIHKLTSIIGEAIFDGIKVETLRDRIEDELAIELSDIIIGESFTSDDVVYMKTNMIHDGSNIVCVDINTGIVKVFEPSASVSRSY